MKKNKKENTIIFDKNGYMFRTIIEPDDPSGYHGYVPSLPGVHTCGETMEETKENLRDAILCHLEGLLKDKEEFKHDENSMEVMQTVFPSDFYHQPIPQFAYA